MRFHWEGGQKGAVAGNARSTGTNLLIAGQMLYPSRAPENSSCETSPACIVYRRYRGIGLPNLAVFERRDHEPEMKPARRLGAGRRRD